MSAPATGGTVWAIVGATGTGKTSLSLDLADALAATGRRAEIVNADAMQLYRGMDIGTAKLSPAERRGIPHHCIDVLEVTDEASVSAYQALARRVIADIHGRGADAVLIGGSGLYVSSVLFDFRFPPRDDRLRERLEHRLVVDGPGVLYAELAAADPATAARVDARNGRRIVRALEVLAQGAPGHGAAMPDDLRHWFADTRVIGVEVPRVELVGDLDARVQRMWDDGLVAEVAGLRDGLERSVTAARAIGYAQALAQVRGEMTATEAIAATQALTRRYARRQASWFRRYRDVQWVGRGAPARELVVPG